MGTFSHYEYEQACGIAPAEQEFPAIELSVLPEARHIGSADKVFVAVFAIRQCELIGKTGTTTDSSDGWFTVTMQDIS